MGATSQKVRITYPVETPDGNVERSLPLVIGVLADLGGKPEAGSLLYRKIIDLNSENLDAVVAGVEPRVSFEVDNVLCGGRVFIELRFRSMVDFEPDGILQQLEPLSRELRISGRLRSAPEENGGLWVGRSHPAGLGSDPAALSRQLDEILHAPEFRRVEAAWRGLQYLVHHVPDAPDVRVLVLNAGKRELLRDFQKAREYDQTAIFRHVHDLVYGVLGAAPFSLLIGDYEFSHEKDDMFLLEGLARVCNAAHAPFIAAASPLMFGHEEFSDIDARSLDVFRSETHARWRAFRRSDCSRDVCLVLPRMALRAPYSESTMPAVQALRYEEGRGVTLWGNSAYALGGRIADSFRSHGWYAAIRGYESGGLVSGLPAWSGGSVTDAKIGEKLDSEIAAHGLTVLLQSFGGREACFWGVSSCAEGGEDRRQVPLAPLLAASQFARLVKVMVRDRLARFGSSDDCERWLREWLSRYVATAGAETDARHPLAQADVTLLERSGVTYALLHVRPGYQFFGHAPLFRFVCVLPPQFRAGGQSGT